MRENALRLPKLGEKGGKHGPHAPPPPPPPLNPPLHLADVHWLKQLHVPGYPTITTNIRVIGSLV